MLQRSKFILSISRGPTIDLAIRTRARMTLDGAGPRIVDELGTARR